MIRSLEARLEYLEEYEDVNTHAISILKQKVCDLTLENIQVTEKLVKMEARCRKLEDDMKLCVGGVRDFIDNRLANIESHMSKLKEGENRSCKLESDSNLARQNSSDHGWSTTEKGDTIHMEGHYPIKQALINLKEKGDQLGKLESEVTLSHQNSSDHGWSSTEKEDNFHLEGHSIEQEKKVQNLDACAKDIASVTTLIGDLSEEQEITNRTFCADDDRMRIIEKQAEELQNRIQILEGIRDQISQSLTSVELMPKDQLKTKKLVELNNCTEVVSNCGFFNVDSCCLEPPISGDYLVNVNFVQHGSGEIEVRFSGARELFVGNTLNNNDVCCTTHLFRLYKGERLFLEAIRMEGNASIGWCDMTSCLISPLSSTVKHKDLEQTNIGVTDIVKT